MTSKVLPETHIPITATADAAPREPSLTARVCQCICRCLPCPKVLQNTDRSRVHVETDKHGRQTVVKYYKDEAPYLDPMLNPLREKIQTTGSHTLYPITREGKRGKTEWIAPYIRPTGTDYMRFNNLEELLQSALFKANHPYPEPHKNVIRIIFDLLSGPLEAYENAHTLKLFNYGIGDLKPEQVLLSSKAKAGLAPYIKLILADLSECQPPYERSPGYCPPEQLEMPFIHSNDLFALQVILLSLLGTTLSNQLTFDAELPDKQEGMPEAMRTMNPTFFYFSVSEGEVVPPKLTQNLNSNYDNLICAIIENEQLPQETTLIAACLFNCLQIAKKGYEKAYDLRATPQAAQASVIATLKEMQAYIKADFLPNSGPTGSPLASRSSSPRFSGPESKV